MYVHTYLHCLCAVGYHVFVCVHALELHILCLVCSFRVGFNAALYKLCVQGVYCAEFPCSIQHDSTPHHVPKQTILILSAHYMYAYVIEWSVAI